MSLAEFQRAYVRLCADASARSRWREDVEGFLGEHPGLDAKERAALSGLDAESLERYAQGLLSKRAEEVAGHLGRSERAGAGLVGRYRRWLATHPAPPSSPALPPGLREALRFVPALRAELRAEGRADVADLASFEVWEAASRLDGQVRELEGAGERVDLRLMALERGEPWEEPWGAARYGFRFGAHKVQWRRL